MIWQFRYPSRNVAPCGPTGLSSEIEVRKWWNSFTNEWSQPNPPPWLTQYLPMYGCSLASTFRVL